MPKCVYPDLEGLRDTFYTGPYTDVNADCILRLQHHQDTYISHCKNLAVKRPYVITQVNTKVFHNALTRTS